MTVRRKDQKHFHFTRGQSAVRRAEQELRRLQSLELKAQVGDVKLFGCSLSE